MWARISPAHYNRLTLRSLLGILSAVETNAL